MILREAIPKIENLCMKPFYEIFSKLELEGIIRNKGKSGQILELAIGLNNSSTTLDFEDGELKSNKVDRNGKPLETMFIIQISSIIDNLLNANDFYQSKLYRKINNLLYVPICKEGDVNEWFLFRPIHVNLNNDVFKDILVQLENDYYSICEQLISHIGKEDGFIHTSNGKYIQIRSKDSRPYYPIYSKKYGRYISNKNHAFYFKKEFMKEIQSIGYGI